MNGSKLLKKIKSSSKNEDKHAKSVTKATKNAPSEIDDIFASTNHLSEFESGFDEDSFRNDEELPKKKKKKVESVSTSSVEYPSKSTSKRDLAQDSNDSKIVKIVKEKRKAVEDLKSERKSSEESVPATTMAAESIKSKAVIKTTPTATASLTSAVTNLSTVATGTKSNNVPIESFDISQATQDALRKRGIENLFEIQAKTYVPIRAGKDLIGRARTGQGKTLAFCLPLLEQMLSKTDKAPIGIRGALPKALLLSPTRELAKQIVDEFVSIAPKNLRIECIYGGVPLDGNRRVLFDGVDVIVGTPGRVKDVLEKGWLKLQEVRHLCLDEADRMLDMGFSEDINTVFVTMKDAKDKAQISMEQVQVLLFSATMPNWCLELAKKYMKSDREYVNLVGDSKLQAATQVRHIAVVSHWTQLASNINNIIAMHNGNNGRVLVFCATKAECDNISMSKAIKLESHVLHGDIPQAKRESTLQGYKNLNFRVLIATDVAARGLDLHVDLVINATVPTKNLSGNADVETYVHRSGRTGRAGSSGICVTFYSPKTKPVLLEIERKVGNKFEWMGAPQVSEVLDGSARRAIESLQKVPTEISSLFQTYAADLLESMDPQDALSAALALITGTTEKPKTRSILSGYDGCVGIEFLSGKVIPSLGYIFATLQRSFSAEFVQAVKGMKLRADKMGACFDIPEEHLGQVTSKIEQMEGFQWLQLIKEVPPLLEVETHAADRLGNQHGNNNSRTGFMRSGRGGRGEGSDRGGRGSRGESSGRGRGGRGEGGGRGGGFFSVRDSEAGGKRKRDQ